MDEVYTCLCGCQHWSIHDGFIRCMLCGKDYKHQTYVKKFNEKIKKQKKEG